jgi:capsular exopolysaccharide synthesis family protein
MSYIFDGLQRAQAERGAANEQKSLAAIELLERAERQATAQGSSELLQEQPAKDKTKHHGPVLGDESFGSGAKESDLTAITNALKGEERREFFSQLQTLEVTQSGTSRLVCLGDSDSPATEAFHLLGVRLRDLRKERALKRLLITSTIPQEGKSLVAANLACTLGSGARQKVLLLEGDVRRPAQAGIFGITQVPGLCDFLLGKRSLTASLYHLPKAGIWILPAGDNEGSFRELIQSPQLPSLMTTLDSWFDWIVIDSPPVLPLIDTSVWARLADGILLVARRGTTRKRKLQKGLEALDTNKVIGALLNSSRNAIDGYDYYYGYGHATGSSRKQGTPVD